MIGVPKAFQRRTGHARCFAGHADQPDLVRVRVRAASARAVIAAVDYRIQVAGALDEDLRLRKPARTGASFIDRQALEGFETRPPQPPDRFLIDLTPLFECTILKED